MLWREWETRRRSQSVLRSYQATLIPCENSAREAGTQGLGARGVRFVGPSLFMVMFMECMRHSPGREYSQQTPQTSPSRANAMAGLAYTGSYVVHQQKPSWNLDPIRVGVRVWERRRGVTR